MSWWSAPRSTEIADAVRIAAEHGPEDVLVTDAGSTKRRIVEAVERRPGRGEGLRRRPPDRGLRAQGGRARPRRPVRGAGLRAHPDRPHAPTTGCSGPGASGSRLGCRVIELDPAEHDDVLALTSHLPHAVAAALAATVPAEALPMAAGAYRDGTRVAGSDAALWAGIFRENQGPTLRALAPFQDQLGAFRQGPGGGRRRLDPRLVGRPPRAARACFDAQHRPTVPDD